METTGKLTLRGLVVSTGWKLVPMLLLVALVAVSGAYPMRLIQRIVNLAVKRGAAHRETEMVALGLLYGAAFVLESLARYALNVLYRSLQAQQGHRLRYGIWAHALRLKPLSATGTTTSTIVMDALKDSEITSTNFMGPVVYIAQSAAEFATGIVVMASISWRMTLLVVPLGIISALMVCRTGATMRSLTGAVRDRTTEMWAWFSEAMRGVKDLQTNRGVARMHARLVERSAAATTANIEVAVYDERVGAANRVFFMTVIATIMTVGALLVSRNALSIGGLTAFMMYNGMLVDPIANYLRRYAELQATRVSIDRLNRLLALPAFADSGPPLARDTSEVTFSDVWFAYGDDPPLFKGFNWHVAAGEHVAVVGPSGSGKTTLAHLIAGLYHPTHGRIAVGADNRPGKGDAVRDHIGVVLQDPHLFNMSLADNLRLGCDDADAQRLWRALRLAGLEAYAAAAPQGLETPLGEGGGRLSGGERQRVAIARALVRAPNILLLDEGTSALDSTTARAVLTAVTRQLAGTTVIVIAHKISSVVGFPRIVVLDSGGIVGDGSHEALLAGCPRYADLHAHQFADGQWDQR